MHDKLNDSQHGFKEYGSVGAVKVTCGLLSIEDYIKWIDGLVSKTQKTKGHPPIFSGMPFLVRNRKLDYSDVCS
ncbi:hypothetical protein KAR91_13150, partial [Candidatus Pacearchaeota archaeon]|nr:hypothetical protein [Candidatus Pacearchaeota archaeon]